MTKTTKRIIIIISCVLACIFVTSLIGNLTNGFEDLFNPSEWNAKEINPDNYIKKDMYLDDISDTYASGIDVNITDDGLIKIKGENKTDTEFSFDVCKVTLPAGTYTFTSGVEGTSASKYYMQLSNGTNTYTADFNNNTFEVAAEGEYTVSFVILPGEKVSATFAPVIVAGEEEGSFYLD